MYLPKFLINPISHTQSYSAVTPVRVQYLVQGYRTLSVSDVDSPTWSTGDLLYHVNLNPTHKKDLCDLVSPQEVIIFGWNSKVYIHKLYIYIYYLNTVPKKTIKINNKNKKPKPFFAPDRKHAL